MRAHKLSRGRTLAAVLTLGAGLLAASAANAVLAPGAKAPDFKARATLGGKEFDVSLAAMLQKGPVVVYFYPAAFTSGCTVEAHDFAEAIPEFEQLGAHVIGVSEDGIAKLDKFSVSACQSKFPVAADPDGSITHSFDAAMMIIPGHASRTSYAIGPDGTILAAYSAMDPDGHVARMLEAVKQWQLKSAHANQG
ncbi:peroxiredoxin [Lichenicola sp.]|uniref:peroxiredoxin n=1 Tax=Lichenicola sp. TaxID=2804529 RepID=UPI003AFFD2E9